MSLRSSGLRLCLRNSASNAEPCQPAGKFAGREIDLQNSSVSRIASRLGAVKDRRRIEPDVSGVGKASGGPAPLNDRLQFAFRNLSQPMGSRRDQKRCVRLGHRVQMNAERHHAGQQIKRWRHVKQTTLDGPRAKALDLYPPGDHDRSILMPGKSPVGGRRLVEEDGSDRPGGVAEDRGRHLPDRAW